MENLGEYLKREREKRGIAIDDASRATKIRKAYLQAMEEGNFDVQSPVFMRGFIKSYAEFLGIDAADVLERYKSLTKEKGVEREEVKPEPLISKRHIAIGIAISILAFIFIALSLTAKESFMASRESTPQMPPMENMTAYPLEVTEKPFPSSTTLKAPMIPSPEQGVMTNQTTGRHKKRYTLLVAAKELTWLRITIDNGNPFEVLMNEGETRSWTADRRVIVLSGNAGGVELTLNGKQLGALGERGKIVSKVLPETEQPR